MSSLSEDKYNLVIVDKRPEVENFTYCGITKDDKKFVKEQMLDYTEKYLNFDYDEGEAIVVKDVIHSIVFTDYISAEEMEIGTVEDE
jgi:hypothetical protein